MGLNIRGIFISVAIGAVNIASAQPPAQPHAKPSVPQAHVAPPSDDVRDLRDRVYARLRQADEAGELVSEQSDLCAADNISRYSVALQVLRQRALDRDDAQLKDVLPAERLRYKRDHAKILDRAAEDFMFAQSLLAMMSCDEDPLRTPPNVVNGKRLILR